MDNTKEERSGLLVSIILPVYNVEDYLERCIRSLENQDVPHEQYEIIVVNDGSPDNSREVVLRLMTEFNNIVFIEQENKGVSLARNAGIDRAAGGYLLFVDPDDYVAPHTFKKVMAETESVKSQVTFLTYRFLDIQGNKVREIFNEKHAGIVYTGIDAYPLSRGDGKADPDRSWGILFERNFVNKNQLRYISQIPYLEDGEFIARVMCLANRVSFNAKSFYLRTTRIGSAMNSNLFFQEHSVNGFIRAAVNLSNFRKNTSLNKNQRTFLNQPICKFVLLSLVPYTSISGLVKFKETLRKLRDVQFSNLNLDGCNNYYKVEGGFFNFSPYLFFIHRLLKAPILKIIKP